MRAPRQCTHSSAHWICRKTDEWQRTVLKIRTSNEEFYRCLQSGCAGHGRPAAAAEGHGPHGVVPAPDCRGFVATGSAGHVIVSLQAMIVYPGIRRGALEVLGSFKRSAPMTTATPSRARSCMSCDTGSWRIQSDPAHAVLRDRRRDAAVSVALHAAWRATGDRALIERHLPAAELASPGSMNMATAMMTGSRNTDPSTPYENMAWKIPAMP